MLEKQNSHRTEKRDKKTASSASSHPDHTLHLKRLHRVGGQIQGIEKMILDKRYCPDIINQLKAATSALRAIEAEIFKSHLRGCVRTAFESKDVNASGAKIEEIMKIVY